MRTKRTERTEQTGRMPLPVKCAAIGLTLAVLAGTALYCWLGYKPSSYTVCSDDGYYSETTYYRTEEAFERAQEGEANGGAVQVRSTGMGGTAAQEEPEGEFVSAATKTVWVSETVHESGAVLDSHLMTKAEIEETEEKYASRLKLNMTPKEIPIGYERQEFYRLTMDFSVTKQSSDADKYTYFLEGWVWWEAGFDWFQVAEKSAEETYFDYVAFTWGGDGALYKTDDSAVGTYFNGKSASIGKKLDEPSTGVMWQFHEKDGNLGPELKKSTFTACLDYNEPFQDKKAQSKMIYVHTYERAIGSINFSAGIDSGGVSAAAGVTINTTQDNWQLETSIIGLEY